MHLICQMLEDNKVFVDDPVVDDRSSDKESHSMTQHQLLM